MKLMNTVIPFLGEAKNGKPRPVGSGILLQVVRERFLITAAHVLDENGVTNLYLPGKEELVMLSGEGKSTVAPEGNRDLDRHDLAYVHLSQAIVSAISEAYWFLPVALVEVDDVSTEGDHYIFTGYPHKAINYKYGTSKLTAQLESYEDVICSPSVYEKAGADPNYHVVIHFDSKRVKDQTGRIVTPKERKGMSGGGVWNEALGRSAGNLPNTRLCGIVIEHQPQNQCLIATRITGVLEMIRRDFSHISEAIPCSKTLLVNCQESESNSFRDHSTIESNVSEDVHDCNITSVD